MTETLRAHSFEALLASSAGVFTIRQARDAGLSRVDIRRAVTAGQLERIGTGAYALADPDRTPSDTFRLRVIAAMRRRRWPTDAASHAAALSLHGLPLYDCTFAYVDVDSHTGSPRRHGRLQIHEWRDGTQRVLVDGVGAVDMATACIQTACVFGFEAGVVAMDAALHSKHLTKRELRRALARFGVCDGAPVARAAVDFADGRCESPGESRLRIILSRNNFRFVPQFIVVDGRSFVARVDFLIDGDLVVEFDGEVKYAGPDAQDVTAAQEAREEWIRSLGYRVLRVTWSELDDPFALVRRVRAEQGTAAA